MSEMEVLDRCPTKVEVTTPEGIGWRVIITKEVKTQAELDAVVEALGGWGAVNLGSGILEGTLFAKAEGADAQISFKSLITPVAPPEPRLITEIRQRIEQAQIESGSE